MKTIQPVSPIQLADKNGNPVLGFDATNFYTYVYENLLNDKVFCAGFKATCAGLDIKNAFLKAEEGAPILLDDSTYLLLKKAVENPEPVAGNQVTPEASRQYLPFMKAIMDAE